MSVEFGASIRLDSKSALDQMRKFAASSKEASKALKELQAETKSTAQGLSKNIFRNYINSSRAANTQTERAIAKIHDQTVAFSKLDKEQKDLIATIDKLNRKYDDSAAAEAKLMQIRKELRMVTAAGLKTQKEADEIYAREAKRLRESTTLYKEREAQIAKSNQLRKEETRRVHELRMKYDKLYAVQTKEKKVIKELNVLLGKGLITSKQYNQILKNQRIQIEHTTSAFQRMAGAQSLLSKTARLVSIYSRVFLGLYAAARLGTFIKDLEQTAEKIQLLTDKLVFLTGDSGAYNKLFDMTQEVGIAMESANKIITRFAVVTDRAFSIDTMNQWAATIIKSARATGTSTQEMSGALIQITQAMSAGRLMGDEYRSVTENLPLLTVALRDMFRDSELSLKELSSQGLLTTDVLVEGFERLEDIIAGFPDTTDTVEAAIGRLSSAWDNFISNVMDTEFTKTTLNTLSDFLNSWSNQIKEANEINALNRQRELTQQMLDAKESVSIQQKLVDEMKETIEGRGDLTPDFIKTLDQRRLTAATQKLSEYEKVLDDVKKNMEAIATSQSEIDKINADKKLQEEREKDKIYKEQLKTLKFIEKIEKGKSITSIEKDFDLMRRELESKEKRFAEGKPGGIDPDESKRLNDLILQNEQDAIQKVIKTKIDGMLRIRGFKTKFDIEDIEAELSKNNKLLEIEKTFIDRKLQIQSASEARRLGVEQGVSPENLTGITTQRAEELIDALETKKIADIRREINSVTSSIASVGFEAQKTSAIIQRDAIGLLTMEKQNIVGDFNKSVSELEQRLQKIKGTGIDVNKVYNEQYDILKTLRDLKLQESERKLNEGLEDEFSKQTVALRSYELAIIDLNVARQRLVVTDQEYLRELRLINFEYDTQTAKVQALTGELGGLDQVYKGLEHGARSFMENTSTMYEFFTTNTEDLLDSSIGLIIDHSTSAQEAFKALVRSMLFELQKLIIKRAILQAFGGFGVNLGTGSTTSTPFASSTDIGFAPTTMDIGIGSAKGNVFSGKGISAYSGSIVKKPTLFPFESGIGLMGESGSEAILPLKRGSDGKLGVATNSSKTPVVINNYSSANVRTEETTDVNGKDMIKVIVDDAISGMVQNGRFDQIMKPYNVTRTGRR